MIWVCMCYHFLLSQLYEDGKVMGIIFTLEMSKLQIF